MPEKPNVSDRAWNIFKEHLKARNVEEMNRSGSGYFGQFGNAGETAQAYAELVGEDLVRDRGDRQSSGNHAGGPVYELTENGKRFKKILSDF